MKLLTTKNLINFYKPDLFLYITLNGNEYGVTTTHQIEPKDKFLITDPTTNILCKKFVLSKILKKIFQK